MDASRKGNAYDRRKTTILWVSPTILDVYLHKESLLHVLRQLADLGHSTSLVAIRSNSMTQSEDSRVHVTSVPLRYVPLVSPIMYAILLAFVLPVLTAISKPDYVIVEPDISVLSSLLAVFVSKPRRTKFVLDVRSTPVETVGFRGSLKKFWFNSSVMIAKRMFDGITIITPLMKKEICSDFRVIADKVGVWTSGVSATLFNPEDIISRSAELKNELGLTEKFVVFYHGVFTSTRGLAETIKAIRILRPKYPDTTFFLLGSGPMVSELRALIQEEKLQNSVIIHDPVAQPEVPTFIGMCDVAIVPLPNHPYWRFQCPLKLLEYLAMEKVVIVSDIPAHRSIVGEEKCGIYIPSVEPVAIARAIEYAYSNKAKLEEWGRAGRGIIRQRYTWERVAKSLEDYLLSINAKVG